jgi:hypothetical protein
MTMLGTYNFERTMARKTQNEWKCEERKCLKSIRPVHISAVGCPLAPLSRVLLNRRVTRSRLHLIMRMISLMIQVSPNIAIGEGAGMIIPPLIVIRSFPPGRLSFEMERSLRTRIVVTSLVGCNMAR